MMEKSIRTTIAMSEPSPLTYLAAVVALRGQIPGLVSAETQAKIQNLKGILDPKTLASARNGGDWRRGAAGAGAGAGAGGGTYTYNGN